MVIFTIFLCFLAAGSLFAETQVPDGVDEVQVLLDLIKNWGVLLPLVKASAIISISVQVMKKYFSSFKYAEVFVVIGGVSYGVIEAVLSGRSFFDSLLFVLVTSGGAMLIYNVLKKPVATVQALLGR